MESMKGKKDSNGRAVKTVQEDIRNRSVVREEQNNLRYKKQGLNEEVYYTEFEG